MLILCDGTTISYFDILPEWFGISKSVSSQNIQKFSKMLKIRSFLMWSSKTSSNFNVYAPKYDYGTH